MKYPVSISVIMSAYNTDVQFLKEAVDSILNQTFSDFEFIIINDGSTNGLDQYLSTITDSRVKVIQNPHNIGISKSVNIGLNLAKGKYIARMDSDDVSVPTRFEREFAFMEAHPDIVVCGGLEGAIIGGERKNGIPQKPETMEEYRVRMLFINPGPINPTTMLRRETLEAHNIRYNENLISGEDYAMWEELSHYGRIYRLNEVLLYRRKHANQISVAQREITNQGDMVTQKKLLTELLGTVTDEEVAFHYKHSTVHFRDAVISPQVAEWYDRLIEANKIKGIYDQKLLEKRIMIIKKFLIRKTVTPEMSLSEELRLIFHYLPFFSGVRMLAGNIKRRIKK